MSFVYFIVFIKKHLAFLHFSSFCCTNSSFALIWSTSILYSSQISCILVMSLSQWGKWLSNAQVSCVVNFLIWYIGEFFLRKKDGWFVERSRNGPTGWPRVPSKAGTRATSTTSKAARARSSTRPSASRGQSSATCPVRALHASKR